MGGLVTQEQERLYTAADVARMTGLPERSVRDLLKNGKIKGTKAGGRTLFSELEVETILSEEKMVIKTAADNEEDIRDFINGSYSDLTGKLQICVIADMYVQTREEARAAADRISAIIAGGDYVKSEGRQSFSYNYSEKEKRARFTLFGGRSFVDAALTGLNIE